MGLTPVTSLSRPGRPPKVTILEYNSHHPFNPMVYAITVDATVYEFRLTDGLRPIRETKRLVAKFPTLPITPSSDYSYAREVVKAFIA